MTAPTNSTEQMQQCLLSQRAAFNRNRYPTLKQRLVNLRLLESLIRENHAAICAAIDKDFGGRHPSEVQMTELFPCLEAIKYTRKRLKRWMKAERRHVSLWYQPARAQVLKQPLGVVGILYPWNYPLFLSIGPLIQVLAAGNRAMIKGSEHTPAFTELLTELIARYFSSDEVSVFSGGPEIGEAFSKLDFDHLFFTGSTAVGRHVMRAAAEHLTPVTLELGGKSPALIADDYSTKTAARRLMFGKCINSGQTCVAPDYVLLPESKLEQFVDDCRQVANEFYGDSTDNLTSIINQDQYQRQRALLDEADAAGARVIPLLDRMNPSGSRQLLPTIVTGAPSDSRLMQEEIFGPTLPVIGYSDLEQAFAIVNQQPRPLALYCFSNKHDIVEKVMRSTHSGGVTVNDTLLHVAQDDLPFGGVGASGMGQYHGYEGFLTFSKKRPVLYQSRLNGLALFHPPRGKLAQRLLKFMTGLK